MAARDPTGNTEDADEVYDDAICEMMDQFEASGTASGRLRGPPIAWSPRPLTPMGNHPGPAPPKHPPRPGLSPPIAAKVVYDEEWEQDRKRRRGFAKEIVDDAIGYSNDRAKKFKLGKKSRDTLIEQHVKAQLRWFASNECDGYQMNMDTYMDKIADAHSDLAQATDSLASNVSDVHSALVNIASAATDVASALERD